jgi:hypothetical protein
LAAAWAEEGAGTGEAAGVVEPVPAHRGYTRGPYYGYRRGPRVSGYGGWSDTHRQAIEDQMRGHREAMDRYYSQRRWWSNPWAENRRLWHDSWTRAHREMLEKQREQAREGLEELAPPEPYLPEDRYAPPRLPAPYGGPWGPPGFPW